MKKQYKYIIKTNSKLLAEFAQTPEGGAKILLILTFPFWGISYLVRFVLGGNQK